MARKANSTHTTDPMTENVPNPSDVEITNDTELTSSKPSVEDLLAQINDSVDDIAGSEVVERNAIVPEKNIGLDEEIACKSITYGGLGYLSPKTGAKYRWGEFGSIEYMPFAELKTMQNNSRNYLFKPRIIIQDPCVIAAFRLQPIYEKVAKVHQLEKVLRGSIRDASLAIDTILAVGMRDVVISKVRDMRRNGRLTNIDIIRLLEKKLAFDLSDDVPEQD